NFSSSLFPPDLFYIGDCWPKASVNMVSKKVTQMHFSQEGGRITGFTWDCDSGTGKLYFERSAAAELQGLAKPISPLLRLPGELRNKIYGYLFIDEVLELGAHGDGIQFIHRREDLASGQTVHTLASVCQQLHQETHGLPLTTARLVTTRRDFLKLLDRKDDLINCRMRQVRIVSGFENLVKSRNIASMSPIIDFCREHPHVEVRITIGD
ncbi:uncharacterized protein K460DRAFT_259046, partial [Cucurbitaria berberidis CBS 394.84]